MQSFPLLNIWSAYSLLQSTWDVTVGLSELQSAGYEAAGLADYLSLAAAEQFDREARRRDVTPWIGLSRPVQIGAASCLVSLYALNATGWQELCQMAGTEIADDIDQVASSHLLLLLWREMRPVWEPQRSWLQTLPFGVVVEELLPEDPWHGLPWIPAYPIRFNKHPGAIQAYRVLTRLGTYKPSAYAANIPDYHTVLASYPNSWLTSLFHDAPPRVLPDQRSYMPTVQDQLGTDEQLLVHRAWSELRRWNPQPFAKYAEHLQYELNIVLRMGFASYFLIVDDLVHYAKEHHIAIGPGRGSAAGSLLARTLGITRIDPVKYGLIFERFLNPHRQSLPDIDIDVDSTKRYQLIAYLRQRWGAGHVAQIGTYGTLGRRAVIRDVARALRIPAGSVDDILRRVKLIGNVHSAPKLPQLMNEVDPSGQWWEICSLLEGLPRHASIHAAGVVLSNRPLREFIPCVEDQDGNLVTQMDMTSIEHLGLLKLDVLGLRTLSVMDRIHQHYEDVFETVDAKDSRTLRLLGRGDTDGIFQLDGKGVRQLLQRLQPERAEDIIDVVALYRPGPMDTIQTYLQRRHRREPLPQDILGKICQDTFGVMIYQEQLMILVQRVAGYTLAEADIFRRVISKKDRHSLNDMASEFITRAQENGLALKESMTLWERIVAFADYGFNKSHAAAYGLLSYYMAFLKAHVPLEFWAAELSSLGAERLAAQMTQAVSQGIVIRPPDIRYSNNEFYVASDGNIYAGFGLIRGISLEQATQIQQERANTGPYTSQNEAYSRIANRLSPRLADLIYESGCLRALPGRAIRSSQLELFNTSVTNDSLVVDALKSFGLSWPVATGPIYVRVTGPIDVRWWERTLRRTSKRFPGTCPVIVGNEKGRGYQFDDVVVGPEWESLDALRQLSGVVACGRRVEQKTRWRA